MPSDTLALLDEIVKGAEAASGKGAGQPLRAAEWNALADAIARLARLAAAREKNETDALATTYARIDHQHLGAVGLTWFDAPTRALVEGRGGAADVAARLNDLARDTKGLRDDLAALTGQVDRLRDGVRGATDAQLARDRATQALGDRLDGVIDVDRRVTAIAEGLTKMGGQVQAALDFRNSLLDAAGAPLDLRALSGRVTDLETVRDRLRLADGEVARMRDFESRVAGLEARIVDDGVLDSRLGQRFTALVDDPGNPLTGRAAAAAAATLEPRIAAVEAGVETTRGGIGTLQAQRNADAAQIASLGTRLNTQTARTDSLASTVAGLGGLTGRVATLETGVVAATTRIAGLEGLRGDVTNLRTQIDGLPGLAGDTKALRSDVDAQRARLDNVERSTGAIAGLDSRLGKMEVASENVDALGNRMKVAESSLAALDARATVADSRIDALSTVPNRVATLERNSAEAAAWRRGVDERMSLLPERTAVEDLNRRLANVETSSATQESRLSQIAGQIGGGRINTLEVIRPIRP
jgi:hypothetical protein